MDIRLLLLLCITAMLLLNLLRCKKYHVSAVKAVLLTFTVAAAGLLGTKILFFIENGSWRGQSFFGAVLFIPVFMVPVSWLFRIDIHNAADLIAPSGLLMFAIHKFNCYLDGCCSGMVMWFADGVPVYFPSQLVESFSAIGLTAYMLLWERKPGTDGKVYPMALILYGISRFILNLLRGDSIHFVAGLPIGNVWALVSVAAGYIWLRKRAKCGKT